MTIDLPHFYATHRDRLRKHLPETFRVEGHHFELNEPSVDASFGLTDDIVSIFLEHAARRVLESLGEYQPAWGEAWTLERMADALDSLFPQEPG